MSVGLSAIRDAIRSENGDISKAARRLGVARRTLQNRMREYRLPRGRSGRRKKTIRFRNRSKWLGAGAIALIGGLLIRRQLKK